MRQGLDTGMQAAIAAGVIIPGILASLTFKSGVQNLWTGASPLVWNGDTFQGVGLLAGLAPIVEGTEVRADGTSVSLNGVDPTLYQDSLDDIQLGAPAKIWLACLAPNSLALMGSPYLLFAGLIDRPDFKIGGESISIQLALESRMTNLQRASNRRYTSADQRVEYRMTLPSAGWKSSTIKPSSGIHDSLMPLTRFPNWDLKGLGPYLYAHASDPFVWGRQDCCLFAANAIQSFTGVDLADAFRDRYTDEASAFELVKRLTGGETVADAAEYCAGKHGLTEWKFPLQAQRGDLVVVENAGRTIAGVVDLSGRFARSMADSGPIQLPLTAVKRAWKV